MLAGLASATAIASLRAGPVVPAPTGPSPEQAPASASALVPVSLASPGLAAILRNGDLVDLVAVDPTGTGRVVASGARVVTRGGSGSLISGSTAAVLLMAVPPAGAVSLAALATTQPLTAVIRERATDR